MTALICGSLAFDTVMVFPGRFKDHILPDKIHMLNVAFLAPKLTRYFGGCAGNIAYNLKLLGGEPVIMATVGDDFGLYRDRLQRLGIESTHLRPVPETYTAQAFITTDLDDNQITAFHPGAMNHAHANRVGEAAGIKLGIVSPDGRQGMLEHAHQFKEAGIPFIFDPGQGMPMFNGEELLEFVRQAAYLTVNDYEGKLMEERTGQSLESLARQVKALVLTHGAQGSRIFAGGEMHEIPPARPSEVLDPTGCGDAYRAGLMYGILKGYDWKTTGRLASLLGAIKIAKRGGQNHRFTPQEITDRFQAEYGYTL